MTLRTWLAVCAGTLVLCMLTAGCTIGGGTGAAQQDGSADGHWNLTLNGTTERVITLDDLRQFPAVTGHGWAVSTTGIRFGPYILKGVDIRDLVTAAGGMDEDDQVWVSAPDGYLWVFDHDQVQGAGFITFNESLKEIPAPPLRIILVYEQDNHPVPYNDGGPARIAIVSEVPGVITEGSAWVKWVDRIEIRKR